MNPPEESARVSEAQMSPGVYRPEASPAQKAAPDSVFLDFQPSEGDADVSGFIDPSGSLGGTGSRRRLKAGRAGAFLEGRGFGWLMEVEEEEDEELQRPLLEELDIDLTDIYYKLRCVLLPLPYFRLKLGIVRDAPDFWGPLLVVLCFALVSVMGQLGAVSWILTIWFFGSAGIFFLGRVLGAEVGYAQCLGVIGYCLLPLVVTGLGTPLLARLLPVLEHPLKLLGLAWAVYSAGTLLCVEELGSKRPLLLYPVFLLYLYFLSIYTGV